MNKRNRHPVASREEIERMKTLHKCGWSVRQLADKYGLTKSTVHRYVTGQIGYENADPINE